MKPRISLRLIKGLFCISIFVLFCNVLWCAEENCYIENLAAYRHEFASDEDENIFIGRISVRDLYRYNYQEVQFEVFPFFEARRHFELNRWYLNTIGANIRVTCFKYLSFDNGLQYSQTDVPDIYFKKVRLDKDRFEAKSALNLTVPLWEIYGMAPYLSATNEFFYDIEHGEPLRNEIGVGLRLPINKRIDIGFAWRHLDWVKDFDSDQVEISTIIAI